jgi:hypothetical protein
MDCGRGVVRGKGRCRLVAAGMGCGGLGDKQIYVRVCLLGAQFGLSNWLVLEREGGLEREGEN